MNISASTVEEYFSKTGEHEPALRQLDETIRASAPHLTRELFQGMGGGSALGYGMMPYQTKSMKQPGKWPLVVLASQKNHMSLYLCAVIDGEYIAESHASKLGNVSVGKSCVRFKKFDDIDINTLRSILGELDTRFAAGEKLYGI